MKSRFLFVLWLFLLGGLIGIQVGAGFIALSGVFSQVGEVLANTSEAGGVAGAIFDRLYIISGCLYILIVLGMIPILIMESRTGSDRTTKVMYLAAVLVVMAGLLLLTEVLAITPQIHSLRIELGAEYGSVSDTPESDPRRGTFAMLHGLSMLRGLIEILLNIAAFFSAGCCGFRRTGP